MNCACTFIEDSADNEIGNPDLGHSLLEEYQKIKRGRFSKKKKRKIKLDQKKFSKNTILFQKFSNHHYQRSKKAKTF